MPEGSFGPPRLLNEFADVTAVATPFRHWRLRQILPETTLAALDALPFRPSAIGETLGRRETHNGTRLFCGTRERQVHAVCNGLALAFQGLVTVERIEALCGIMLRGTYLRIEYCQDTDGFWLEPHTDIGAKKLTLLIYLSDPPPGEDWGTDIYDPEGRHAGSVPSRRNEGLMFVPGADSWHGFERGKKITGVRRTLIVNYVGAEWRARHELAFPDLPVS